MVLEFWQFIQPQTPAVPVDSAFSDAGYNTFALEVGDLEAEIQRLAAVGVLQDAPMRL